MLVRELVTFQRETNEDKPVAGAVDLTVTCVYEPLRLGTRVHLYVLPEALAASSIHGMWLIHGDFLEDKALVALNYDIQIRFGRALTVFRYARSSDSNGKLPQGGLIGSVKADSDYPQGCVDYDHALPPPVMYQHHLTEVYPRP